MNKEMTTEVLVKEGSKKLAMKIFAAPSKTKKIYKRKGIRREKLSLLI